uniref:Uncharacterized protein n=2 Tax=viral metagenome TaxID=1070528 RepID=A0A6H1ZJX8_9ZZZZ
MMGRKNKKHEKEVIEKVVVEPEPQPEPIPEPPKVVCKFNGSSFVENSGEERMNNPEPEPVPDGFDSLWACGSYDSNEDVVRLFNGLVRRGYVIANSDFEYPRTGGVSVVYEIKRR